MKFSAAPFPLNCDFRSDTVTQPDAGMRQAMAEAPVGDDVFLEDPTVFALEEKIAHWTGKPAALFFPTGCMANLTALMAQTQPGQALFTGNHSHIKLYELGSYARIAGLHLCPVQDDSGYLSVADLTANWLSDAYHLPRPGMITVENTQNVLGGLIYPHSNLAELAAFAQEKGVPIHLDGARLFHACAGSGLPPETWTQYVDTVMVCTSKGLGAPAGSLLAGPQPIIEQARIIRKLLGGGMRQVGILAAAGLYAFEHNLPRLNADVLRCQGVHRALSDIPNLSLSRPDTNILILKLDSPRAEAMVTFLNEKGFGTLALGLATVRIVFHLHITDAACDELVQAVRAFLT
ncbi:MAG: aminotransferase class I/II-fold pyridoxal phosphate-dependent enzyme [Acidobacteria bacterium]|nr:aminotransferase class I/II-fold pyridoxal phosphate-dependent enzyme [Acidobacteriota bacterium]MCB9396972.1 aminotransferase class I/II-fold pyridoxal phosphate-dependent enzyme [Acidobacteriota bacterium]